MNLKTEALKRMKILVDIGMFKQVYNHFEKTGDALITEEIKRKAGNRTAIKGLLFSKSEINTMPDYKMYDIPKRIKDFETNENAIVYHAILDKTSEGLCLFLFYVSDSKKYWRRAKKDLRNKKAIVYSMNLTNGSLSDDKYILFFPSHGSLVRVF